MQLFVVWLFCQIAPVRALCFIEGYLHQCEFYSSALMTNKHGKKKVNASFFILFNRGKQFFVSWERR